MPTFRAKIYSPRWGHEDTYEFNFDQDQLKISMPPRVATCNYIEGQDPVWKGESLQRILRNDSIYAPEIFPALIQHLWLAWRDGDIRSEQVDAELQAVVEWLNATTKAKPRSEFWRKYF